MKEVLFHENAREVVRGFSSPAKDDIGLLLRALQEGKILAFPHSKPMPEIEAGVHELRVKDMDGIYRVFYYLKSAKGILVFHAFTKKTQATPKNEIALGKKRLWEMLNQ